MDFHEDFSHVTYSDKPSIFCESPQQQNPWKLVSNQQWWNLSIYLYPASILYCLFKCKTNKDLSYKQLFVKSQRSHLDCHWQDEMKHWVVYEHRGRNLRLSPFRCFQCRFSPLFQTQSHLHLHHHHFYHHLARYQLEWTEIKLTVMTDWNYYR